MCGGAARAVLVAKVAVGLSPRVRGSHTRAYLRQVRIRSIPTCAGEPPSCWGNHRRIRVYPHVCGGAICAPRMREMVDGLSPRVRGSPAGQQAYIDDVRSIPTCAGEPDASQAPGSLPRVYPHVCGGAVGASLTLGSGVGLSPRVRGSHAQEPAHSRRSGSIPTCAGEPRSARARCSHS